MKEMFQIVCYFISRMALTSQAWKAEARGLQICNFLKPVVMSVAGKEPMEQSILSRDRSTIEDWSEGQTGRKNGFCQNLNVHYLRAASQLTVGGRRMEIGQPMGTAGLSHDSWLAVRPVLSLFMHFFTSRTQRQKALECPAERPEHQGRGEDRTS